MKGTLAILLARVALVLLPHAASVASGHQVGPRAAFPKMLTADELAIY